jgi:hypothetical protein
MTNASNCVVKLVILCIGLALISSGCATTHPSDPPSVTFVPLDNKPLVVQPQPADPPKQLALQNNPFGESVCIAAGLAQLGSYLVVGK